MVRLVRIGRKPSELSRIWLAMKPAFELGYQAGEVQPLALPANVAALNAQERQELIELRRKLRQVQMERDILAKATAWFAGKSEKTFTPSMNS